MRKKEAKSNEAPRGAIVTSVRSGGASTFECAGSVRWAAGARAGAHHAPLTSGPASARSATSCTIAGLTVSCCVKPDATTSTAAL